MISHYFSLISLYDSLQHRISLQTTEPASVAYQLTTYAVILEDELNQRYCNL